MRCLLHVGFLYRILKSPSSVRTYSTHIDERVELLSILKYPAPQLRASNVEVTEFGDELKAISRRMFDAMYDGVGVGLAAPQVGINQQLIVCNHEGDRRRWLSEMVLVNPKIVNNSAQLETETEACLSFPDISGPVKRFTWIEVDNKYIVVKFLPLTDYETNLSLFVQVEAQNLEGDKFVARFEHFEARLFQHEFDHLQGVLFVDRLEQGAKIGIEETLAKMEKQYNSDI